MYTEQELQQLRKAIYENTADLLLWQVLYIISVAQHSSSLDVVRKKLLSSPKTFQLIMQNSVNSPYVKELAKAVYDGNNLFVRYIDGVFCNGADQNTIRQELQRKVHEIADCMHRINPQWGIDKWVTLMQHQIDLMDAVMADVKGGHYDSWADVLPIIRKLKMDMADYLAHGISSCDHSVSSVSPSGNGF